MASFDAVNYSLRPSKSIQRNLVFEGVQSLMPHVYPDGLTYIGMGSIWFTDFVMAHKILRVRRSISIESNEIGYLRARFNAPYATVEVVKGQTTDQLPKILTDKDVVSRPAMIWSDYDYELNESINDDIRLVIERAPKGSVFLVTFNGLEHKYGKPHERVARLRSLLGTLVPDELKRDDCANERMSKTLADLVLKRMVSIAQDGARLGGFVPAFKLLYKDGAPMVTVGGVLPDPDNLETTKALVSKTDWPSILEEVISAPHLTLKEAAALQAKLPQQQALTRASVKLLGFDLDEAQVKAFEKYYLRYPSFAQILT